MERVTSTRRACWGMWGWSVARSLSFSAHIVHIAPNIKAAYYCISAANTERLCLHFCELSLPTASIVVACQILAASATQDTSFMKIFSVWNFFEGALSSGSNIDCYVIIRSFLYSIFNIQCETVLHAGGCVELIGLFIHMVAC